MMDPNLNTLAFATIAICLVVAVLFGFDIA